MNGLVENAKGIVSITRDGIITLILVLLLLVPATVNKSLVEAGFKKGSIAGFEWEAVRDNVEDNNKKLSEATTTIETLQGQLTKTEGFAGILRDNGIEPEVVQYLKTPPTRAELVKMIRAAGIDVRTAVRKREALYAELGLADASDDELLDAMAEHPILIERPFVVTPKGTRLARPIDAVREIL